MQYSIVAKIKVMPRVRPKDLVNRLQEIICYELAIATFTMQGYIILLSTPQRSKL